MTKGSSNTEVRVYNQKRIVSTLFHEGPMTKKDLAARLGLSLPTISVILAALSDKGLVVRGEKLASTGGRPPSHIQLAFDAKVAVGVDVSTRHVRLALVDLAPRVVAEASHLLDYKGTPAYWRKVRALVDRFLEANRVEPRRRLGIGLSVQVPVEDGAPKPAAPAAGPVDRWDFDLVRSILGPDVAILNDAKTASLAQVHGIGETEDVVYLMLGSGVGGAVVSNRRIFHWGSKNAEFGHMVVHDGGLACACGQRGCLGAYCSSRALRELSGVETDAFFEGLAAGRADFRRIWSAYLHHLAIGVHNLRMAFDTDVILGGELSAYLAPHLEELRALLAERNPFGEGGGYVRLAGFGEYDSAVGAALVHLDHFLS